MCLLDFPVREVHCDAPAETEWEKLAQNLQLKVGLQPPPPPNVGNWTEFVKKKFPFFSLRKSTKRISYILLSTVTHLY